MYERYTYSYMYKGGEMSIGVLYVFVYIHMYICIRVVRCVYCYSVYKYTNVYMYGSGWSDENQLVW